jgi:hypothetical protein
MIISFSGKYAENEVFGVSFQATVDGTHIVCRVDSDVLQDIDPQNRFNNALSQFESNQSTLQNIAEELIRNGKIKDGQLRITKNDIA